ncbi:MAG: asparagine synthase (glutamine-hydrolyzing) [Phycisphaerales bacterium]
MCGIFGIATTEGRSVTLSDAAVCRLRDEMAHRGPDGAGLWRSDTGQFVLAHRRLSVIDPSEAGAQPMLLDDPELGERGRGRYAIVYNGELYNDAELRQDLAAEGAQFCSGCDTETLLRVLSGWGIDGIARLRGMYAFAFVDRVRRRLVLSRDPMGIKPLYYAVSDDGVIFASEPGAVLGAMERPPAPDLATVSAYLSTIRTTMGSRTLFAGVRSLVPGEVLEFGLSGGEVCLTVRLIVEPADVARRGDPSVLGCVEALMDDSVRRHLRSDVPACALLSGGLDSSIIVAIARGQSRGEVRTYCSGHAQGAESEDFGFARIAAAHFGTKHTEAPVTRAMFVERWPEMVGRMGVPLSTPNEVAINEVARRLRRDGQVVALSGEGADELFGGYEAPMMLARTWERSWAETWGRRADDEEKCRAAAGFQVESNAWVPPEAKAAVLRPEVWRSAEHDAALLGWYADEMGACQRSAEGLAAHLMFHRRVNLVGLLVRLDTATMLESVEGRTPFADACVCAWAERQPMERRYTEAAGSPRTKVALREGFSACLPESIVSRPKASFPLPFQGWLGDHVSVLRSSEFARALFREEAVEQVCRDPAGLWRLAWPMINVAMWGARWFRG